MNPVETPVAPTGNETEQGATAGNATQTATKAKRSHRVNRPPVDVQLGAGTNVTPEQAVKAASQAVKGLNEENARLQTLLKQTQKRLATAEAKAGDAGDEVKRPVTDAQLRKACDALIAATRANPAKPNRSLRSQFVVRADAAHWIGEGEAKEGENAMTPLLTDGQKKVWQAAKGEIDSIHTKWTRDEAPKLISIVKRTIPKADSLAAGGYFRRKMKLKDGKTVEKIVGAKISVREAKPRKVDAKPTVNP